MNLLLNVSLFIYSYTAASYSFLSSDEIVSRNNEHFNLLHIVKVSLKMKGNESVENNLRNVKLMK
jgi:hypothetical protein